MASPPLLGRNDAEAIALGEWVLGGRPAGRFISIVMGTGVGAVAVIDGRIVSIEFGHLAPFGPKRCGGCGQVGCLDAQIGGHALPDPLTGHDIGFVVGKLGEAVSRQDDAFDQVIVSGGIPRRYPDIVAGLGTVLRIPVVPSRAPTGCKSAAPFGLLEFWRQSG